jgi:hypothetical protein
MTEKKTRFSSVFGRAPLPSEPDPQSEITASAEPEKKAKTGRAPGKKSNPAYTQVTVYLRKDIHQAARKILIDEQQQFSELVGELVSKWVSEMQKSGNSKV